MRCLKYSMYYKEALTLKRQLDADESPDRIAREQAPISADISKAFD